MVYGHPYGLRTAASLNRVGTYNLARKMPGGEKLVAMTRILHRTTPDEVMDEVRMTDVVTFI